jgi:hypothetical protein
LRVSLGVFLLKRWTLGSCVSFKLVVCIPFTYLGEVGWSHVLGVS